MQIFDVIAQAQNGRAIQNFARAANVEDEQMEAAIRSIVGDMTLSIERNTLNRGGLADLVRAAGDGHHEFILDHPQAMADPRVAMDGNEILEHILGSKDKSRGVALRAAQASGLSDGLIKMLLPYIAQMLMGALSKWLRGSGGLGDIINKLPIPGGGGGGGGLPFPMPGGGGAGSPRGGGMGGGGGFELPRGDIPRTEMPQGGYPMPPIPGGPSGGGTGSYPAPQEQGDGGFQIPWPGGGGSRRGSENQGGSPFPFPFPFPFPRGGSGQQGDDGGFQIPWPRQQEPHTGGGGMGGGFELPKGEMPMPQGGYPMPPIPGGSPSGGGTGSFPAPGQTQEHGNPLPLPLPGPQPGGNNPYGDLSDILRRGGSVPGASGSLGGIVRSILGGLLGFGGRGIMGWVIRLLVMRFGWSFLKRMLGRMLMGGR